MKRSMTSWTMGLALVAGMGMASPVAADEADDQLARTLIDRFYQALAPDSAALKAFMGEGFQIIGSDGLRFDRESYPAFQKAVTRYEIGGLVVRRDRDLLTATFEVSYVGEF